MIALAVVVGVVVLLLSVLVAGLLRSHADILKALHDLGVGVGEPGGSDRTAHAPVAPPGVPLAMGPPLPGERDATSAPTIAGVTPSGDALAISVAGDDRLTLVAFLSSGCATCAGFWKDFSQPDRLELPGGTRLVVVTKGPEMEISAEVASQSPPGVTVVMSTEAWRDYEVPGSPFFVLVDGVSGRRIGEGVANHAHQVVDLVRRAASDAHQFTLARPGTARPGAARTRSRAFAEGLDGPQRERANDRELAAAGVLPGDPSLYPSSLADLHEPVGPGPGRGHRTNGDAAIKAG